MTAKRIIQGIERCVSSIYFPHATRVHLPNDPMLMHGGAFGRLRRSFAPAPDNRHDNHHPDKEGQPKAGP